MCKKILPKGLLVKIVNDTSGRIYVNNGRSANYLNPRKYVLLSLVRSKAGDSMYVKYVCRSQIKKCSQLDQTLYSL